MQLRRRDWRSGASTLHSTNATSELIALFSYGTDIGSEYKERLGCKTEGREYTGLPPTERKKMSTAGTDASTARTASPHFAANASGGIGPKSQKVQNEDFFARKGNENAGRPEGLAPSQGGKYAGFGSAVEPVAVGGKAGAGAAAPGLDDFQADPVAALTKGFGWFTKTVGQGVKTVNDGYIQPTAQKVCLFSFTFCSLYLSFVARGILIKALV